MLNEPIANRYRADGKEAVALTNIQITARNRIKEKLLKGEYKVQAVACHLCHSLEQRCISEKDIYGLPVRVVMCCKCGLLYNSPQLTQDCLPKFYGEHYRELDRSLPSVEAYFNLEYGKGQRIFKLLEDGGMLPQLQDKLVIDIGCGAGGVLGYFKLAGYAVLGCDLIPHHLEFGINERQLDLHYGNLGRLIQIVSERRDEIGLIIYEQVFEHLAEPLEELKKIHQLMDINTLLFIGVPGIRNIDAQYESDLLRYLQLPHLVHFDLERLVALVENNQFEFLVGNEIVQAIFKKTTRAVSSELPSSSSMEKFIIELEERRRRRAFTEWGEHLPYKLARIARVFIDLLPVPHSVKDCILQGLRRIRLLISGSSK